ncbi:GNAT family N-acetyltransferase [Bacillus salitolerans]|uniref:GNAT family N-acetyltransferase n=1 Tax=Bacillus salitolerans TaxID=1437434 RepID=A0ABW4LVY6_9BACI
MKELLTIRHPQKEDAESVCNLVIACDVEDFGAPDFDLNELLDMWADFDLENNVWIVENSQKTIVGYAFLEEDSEEKLFSYGFVLPSARGTGVGAALLHAIEDRAKVLCNDSGLQKRLQNLIPTLREDANQLLKNNGFNPVRYFKRMSISMDQPPKKPLLPEGFSIHPFVKGQDEESVYQTYTESFADHWDYAAPTFDAWVEKTKRPSFTPEWWFVARDEQGKVAGIALCRMREDSLFVNQLGVKSAYRGVGLGLALLQHSFYASYHSGQPVVSLGVDAESPTGAYRLYEKVGMKAVHDVTLCEKLIIPANEKVS